MDHNLHSAIVCYFRELIVSLFSQVIHSDYVTTAAAAPKCIRFPRNVFYQVIASATRDGNIFRQAVLGPVRIVQMLSYRTKDFYIWCQVCQNFPSHTDTCSSVNVANNIRETVGSNPDIQVETCRVFFFLSVHPPPQLGHPWSHDNRFSSTRVPTASYHSKLNNITVETASPNNPRSETEVECELPGTAVKCLQFLSVRS